MKLAPLAAAVLVLCMALPAAMDSGSKKKPKLKTTLKTMLLAAMDSGSKKKPKLKTTLPAAMESGSKKKPKLKKCRGKDGQRYEIGDGYLDTKACIHFTCFKKGKRLKMVRKKLPQPCTVCNSTSNSVTTMGTCLTQQQCSTAGGSSLGTCASGYGVCCKITKNSGTLNSKVGYVENTGYPSTTTTAETTTTNIEVTDSDVCQIRLDFDFFEMDKPTTLQGTTSNCLTESLAVTSTLFTPNNLGVQPLCGINTGQHMYIGDFDLTSTPTTVATLAAISTTNPSKWSIKVTQVDCKATDAFSQNIRAPSNCRQYFTSDTGTMTSYNYGADKASIYSSNQDYQYCVKRNPTDCQIKYVRSSGAPAMYTSVGSQSYPNTAGTAVNNAATCFPTGTPGNPNYANACGSGSDTAGCVFNGNGDAIDDYLSIPSAKYAGDSGAYYTQDFFCGTGVGWSSGTSDAGTGVVSQAGGPFSIRFHAGNDIPENCAVDPCRLGFSLDYTKASTCQTLTTVGTFPSNRKKPYNVKKTVEPKPERESGNTLLLKLLTEINNIKLRMNSLDN